LFFCSFCKPWDFKAWYIRARKRLLTRNTLYILLFFCFADSAKTFAISGLSVVGRDYWGVFPLRGKLLNVRDASPKQILDNQEIQHLKQILGLQQGKEYTDVSSLRYGRVMILTDADVDGRHIAGLVLNMLHFFWPSLLKLGFLSSMNTPVVKATKGSQTLAFYTLNEYEAWKNSTSASGWKIKYFKGLGTSTAAEAKEYFQRIQELTQRFTCSTASDEDSIVMAFQKSMTKERKEWIVENTRNPTLLDRASKNVDVSSFIHQDLVHFSIADVVRSIPSMCDGLKPSQRKVLHGCFKKGLEKDDIKVSQLSGYIAEVTAYHHGDTSLQGTIVGMAQNYTGSNNINLLLPEGQFGTRLQGGKDAASARYIFTKLNPLARKLFDPRDDALLTYLDDDGYSIEPAYFVPTLPMVLINGASGIGTGFSTSVPCFNPQDIRANIKRYLTGSPLEPMTPWYNGFKGTITLTKPHTYAVKGAFEVARPGWVHITELPIGMWTQDYKEWLEDDARRKFELVNYENHSTETAVLFKLQLRPDALRAILAEDPHKTFNLVSTLHTSNMHLFDASGCIKYYETPLDILADFCKTRAAFYKKRKRHLLKTKSAEATMLDERARFIRAVVSGALTVFQRPAPDVREDMKAAGFERIDELLRIPIHNFTGDKIEELEKECAAKHTEVALLGETPYLQLWVNDLKSSK
jgi:DNA topoisomerase II